MTQLTHQKTLAFVRLALVLLVTVIPAITMAAEGPSDEAVKAKEEWVWLHNEHLKVGLLKTHGGAIGYLSKSGDNVNVLNHYDHGRLVQQSYYGDRDGSEWGEQEWRYNPVQGGDYRGVAATVQEVKSTETTAYVKTIPRHWASGQHLAECTMEQWVKLEGPVLQVRYQFTYGGTATHRKRHQETPATFVSPSLATLVTYAGDKPWTNGELTRRVPDWPNEAVSMTEHWAAYVDQNDSGVGVYVPGVSEATCYRFQGGAGSDCSYIAPLRTFALTPNLKFSYTAYFTLGTPATIRSRFQALRELEAK